MHLLWRRYSRSGYAPSIFYWLMAAGFAALAGWGAVRGDWLVAAIALAMAPVTYVGARVMRMLSASASESRARMRQERHDDE